MLSMNLLNELRILRVIDMRSERDLVDRQLARNHVSLERRYLIRFCLDILGTIVHEFMVGSRFTAQAA